MSVRELVLGVAIATAAGLGVLGVGVGEAAAQPAACVPRLAPVRFPAAPGKIYAITSFDDDGDGAESYFIAGDFGVRKLVSGAWVSVGTTALSASRVFVPFDSGTGVRLHVGGGSGVFRLEGGQWVRVGGTLSFNVQSMVVHDDGAGGTGATLDASSRTGGVVSRLMGGAWVAVGATFAGQVQRSTGLAVYDEDGAGPNPARLFSVGASQQIGSVPTLLARWDGAAWSAVTQGVASTANSTWVNSMTVFSPAGGARLALSAHPTNAAPFTSAGTTDWSGAAFTTYPRSLAQVDTFYSMAGFQEVAGGPETLYGLNFNGLVRVSPTSAAAQQYAVVSPVSFNAPDYSQIQMLSIPPRGAAPARLVFPGSTYIAGSPIGVWVGCPRLNSDFNADGVVGVDDVFDMLGYFFGNVRFADVDGNGVVGIDDVLLFLHWWFAGM